MSDLHLERDFAIAPDKLFSWVTQGDKLLRWWGPEGMHIAEHDLDFTSVGPWFSVMQNGDGQRYKVSGHVTHVDAPTLVGFTWAWHDDNDQRGSESHVTLRIQPVADGARLVLDHRDLADGEQADRHEAGWTSSLRKLSAQIG